MGEGTSRDAGAVSGESTLDRGQQTRVSVMASAVSTAGPWASFRTLCVLLASKFVKWGEKPHLPCKLAALGVRAKRC